MSMINQLIETCKAEIKFNSPTVENYSKLVEEVEWTQLKFRIAIKAMLEWAEINERTYISKANAEPFVRNLPEFWREPARIMASLGEYGSADEWMKQNACPSRRPFQ